MCTYTRRLGRAISLMHLRYMTSRRTRSSRGSSPARKYYYTRPRRNGRTHRALCAYPRDTCIHFQVRPPPRRVSEPPFRRINFTSVRNICSFELTRRRWQTFPGEQIRFRKNRAIRTSCSHMRVVQRSPKWTGNVFVRHARVRFPSEPQTSKPTGDKRLNARIHNGAAKALKLYK